MERENKENIWFITSEAGIRPSPPKKPCCAHQGLSAANNAHIQRERLRCSWLFSFTSKLALSVVSGSASVEGPAGRKKAGEPNKQTKHKARCLFIITSNLFRIVSEPQSECAVEHSPSCFASMFHPSRPAGFYINFLLAHRGYLWSLGDEWDPVSPWTSSRWLWRGGGGRVWGGHIALLASMRCKNV